MTSNTNPEPARVLGQYGQISAIAARMLSERDYQERVHHYPHCGITVKTEYFNTMRDDVVLIDRTGFRIHVPGQDNNSGAGALRIVKIYTVSLKLPGQNRWTGLQYFAKAFRDEAMQNIHLPIGQLYRSYMQQYFHMTNNSGYPPNEMKL